MVKICKNCGQKLHENTLLCPDCECTEFITEEGNVNDYKINKNVITRRDMSGNGNIPIGILGAFLLSLVGGAVYFALCQIGFLSGIGGVVIFYLAGFGYKKFSKCNNRVSNAGLITSIVMTIIMIFIAYYLSFSLDMFLYYNETELSFIQMISSVPEILEDNEMYAYFVGDLIRAYAFAFIATIYDIVRIIRYR